MVSVTLPPQARSPPPPATAITPCMVSTVGLCLPLQSRACLHTPSLMYRVRSHRGRIHGALLQHRKDIEPKTEKSSSRWTLLHALHCFCLFHVIFPLFFSFPTSLYRISCSRCAVCIFYSCSIRHNNREWRVLDRGKAGRAIWRLVAFTQKRSSFILLSHLSGSPGIRLPSRLDILARLVYQVISF